ncbi:predicted protein [Histoplasma capsulatum var. duboisii H88]|uniref:Predicted protein n=1 Tax=Ajellomyces capsulatus (strain H88) TaxID=544711 RepID=F0UI12_AJEC8|nr:predicted protein [Histoplasma capsulatum var. duboisii H88]
MSPPNIALAVCDNPQSHRLSILFPPLQADPALTRNRGKKKGKQEYEEFSAAKQAPLPTTAQLAQKFPRNSALPTAAKYFSHLQPPISPREARVDCPSKNFHLTLPVEIWIWVADRNVASPKVTLGALVAALGARGMPLLIKPHIVGLPNACLCHVTHTHI